VLGHGVDERVAGLGVLDEQAADARAQRAEVAQRVQHAHQRHQGRGGEEGGLEAKHLCLRDGQAAAAALHLTVLQHLLGLGLGLGLHLTVLQHLLGLGLGLGLHLTVLQHLKSFCI
jgi:hypothetical protein